MASVAATPASEAESANAPTPTPATPSTPQHANSFNVTKTEGQVQTNMMPTMANGGPEQMAPPQPDPNSMQFGLESDDVSFFVLHIAQQLLTADGFNRIHIACPSTTISAIRTCLRTSILNNSYRAQMAANSISILRRLAMVMASRLE